MLATKTVQVQANHRQVKSTGTTRNLKLVSGNKKLSPETTTIIDLTEIKALLKLSEEFTPVNDVEIAGLIRFPG